MAATPWSDPEKLGEYLRREGMMLRRTKREVLPELPPKRRLVQEIDWDDEVYREYMRPVVEYLRALRGETDASRRAIIEDAISQTERQATGVAKAPYVCACVRTLLEAGEKVLLFAHHHAVMDIYRQRAASAYLPRVHHRPRRRSAEKDARAERAFMDGCEPTCAACPCARPAGMNLQRATCVVFGELDWTPRRSLAGRGPRAPHRPERFAILCYGSGQPARLRPRKCSLHWGLKVSQFVGLMGDETPGPDQQALLESQAREYISRLVHRLDGEMLPDDADIHNERQKKHDA